MAYPNGFNLVAYYARDQLRSSDGVGPLNPRE
jgi:hypothetical protein